MPITNAYVIQYGRLGFVGRFPSELSLGRGDRAVIRSPRGLEVGEVLVAAEARFTAATARDDGEILRRTTPEDERELLSLDARGREVLSAAERGGNDLGLPLVFVDVELTLDGTAILHALPWDACDATTLLDELSVQAGLAVRLLDLSQVGEPATPTSKGCGKTGCGTESGGCSSCGTGGGCSTGSCSRSAVKSSEEMTAYFADLRSKMESAGLARTALN
jgi:hypothetical protein